MAPATSEPASGPASGPGPRPRARSAPLAATAGESDEGGRRFTRARQGRVRSRRRGGVPRVEHRLAALRARYRVAVNDPPASHRAPATGTADVVSRRTAAVVLVVTLLAGAAPAFAADLRIAIPAMAVLAAAALYGRREIPGQVRDATVLVAALWLFLAIPSPALWPLPGLAALLVAGAWAWRRGRWPQWREWLRIGRIGRFAWAMWGLIVVLTVLGLLTWNQVFDGELPRAYQQLAQGVPVPVATTGALAFLVVNGAIEDSIWAGVLLSATERVLPAWLAVGAVAASFGLAHLHGVPGGLVGVLMAGAWGLVLALLRIRTGGMGATYLAHIAADATIVVMLLPAALRT